MPNSANPIKKLMAVGMAKLRSRKSRSGKIGSAARRAVSSQVAVAATARTIRADTAQAGFGLARPTTLASNTMESTAIASKIAPA